MAKDRLSPTSKIILLDAGPLGVISNPLSSPTNLDAKQWMQAQLAKGSLVLISEIADYEVHRELIRAGKIKGIAKLNDLKRTLGFFSDK